MDEKEETNELLGIFMVDLERTKERLKIFRDVTDDILNAVERGIKALGKVKKDE